MPSRQGSWQVRLWCTPSTMARHSKQIPMPQTAVRGSPVTETRQGTPAARNAALAIAPSGTFMGVPLSQTVMRGSGAGSMGSPSAMAGHRRVLTAGKVGRWIDCGGAAEEVIGDEACRTGSVGDAEALEAESQ